MEVLPISRPGNALLDWWTLVHAASGALLALPVRSWWVAAVLLVGWEAFEGVLRRVKRHGKGLFEFESWPNIASDVAVGLAAWALVAWLAPLPDAWAIL